MRARKLIAAAAAFPLVVAAMGVAHADTVNNTIINSAGTGKTITTEGSVQVSYHIEATDSGKLDGCDASDGSPVTLTITAPTAVEVSNNSLVFSACDSAQTVTFSSKTLSTGDGYDITHTPTDSRGSYSLAGVNFKLKVVAPTSSGGGGVVDTDADDDGHDDSADNCPTTANPSQADADNDGLGDVCDSNAFAPELGSLNVAGATGGEGSSLAATGSFTDGDGNSTLTITKTLGDGSVTDNGNGTFSWSHSYGDDSTGSVTVSASDGEHPVVAHEFTWTTNNVAPTVNTVTVSRTSACAVSLSSIFGDPGSLDTHTASINWGDGTTATLIDPATTPVSGSHTYAANGTYTASVTVNDDDGGTDSKSAATAFATQNTASAILQPINAAGKASVFKMGSTIPVKITVTGCDGLPVTTLSPSVHLDHFDATAGATVTEEMTVDEATNGKLMRYADGGYIYNLSTKVSQFTGQAMSVGSYRVTVRDASFFGPAPTATFDVRK